MNEVQQESSLTDPVLASQAQVNLIDNLRQRSTKIGLFSGTYQDLPDGDRTFVNCEGLSATELFVRLLTDQIHTGTNQLVVCTDSVEELGLFITICRNVGIYDKLFSVTKTGRSGPKECYKPAYYSVLWQLPTVSYDSIYGIADTVMFNQQTDDEETAVSETGSIQSSSDILWS